MKPQTQTASLPRITIFSESGPLAGDLAACLAGRFRIDRVSSVRAAQHSLGAGSRAVLILQDLPEISSRGRSKLIDLALRNQCRVLVLGPTDRSLPTAHDARVKRLPSLPSLPTLFNALSGLET